MYVLTNVDVAVTVEPVICQRCTHGHARLILPGAVDICIVVKTAVV
jgi:hypothetical protein